jgi:hypothetical protein
MGSVVARPWPPSKPHMGTGSPICQPSSTLPGANRHLSTEPIGYVSLWVPDIRKAATFFGAELGWSYAPGSGAHGRQIVGATPHHGLYGLHVRRRSGHEVYLGQL